MSENNFISSVTIPLSEYEYLKNGNRRDREIFKKVLEERNIYRDILRDKLRLRSGLIKILAEKDVPVGNVIRSDDKETGKREYELTITFDLEDLERWGVS